MQAANSAADFTLSGKRRAIGRKLRGLVLVTLVLAGCGGRPTSAIGSINHTRHLDAQLWSLWKAAQQSLSQQIDLNPVQRMLANGPPDMLPGDQRVWNISPRQLVVSSQADVASSVLLAATGVSRPGPTGLIFCPDPCNVAYAATYSLLGNERPDTRPHGNLRVTISTCW